MWFASLVRCGLACVGLSVALFNLLPSSTGQTSMAKALDIAKTWQGQTYAGGILVTFLCTAFLEYRTLLRPSKRLAAAMPSIMTALSKNLRDTLKSACPIRMNLMMLYRPVRWVGLRRFLCIAWSEGMDDDPDAGIELPAGCGVVGECLRTKRSVAADEKQLAALLETIPRRRREAVSDLTAVFCFPVFEPPMGGGVQSGRLVGVLTVDSRAPGGFAKLAQAAVMDEAAPKMKELAKVAGWLI